MPSFSAPIVNAAGSVLDGQMSLGRTIFETYSRVVLPISLVGAAAVLVVTGTRRLLFGERSGQVGMSMMGARHFLVEGTLAGMVAEAPEQPPAAEVIRPAAPLELRPPPDEQIFEAIKDPVAVEVNMPPMWLRDP